jgi:hypothetical protein
LEYFQNSGIVLTESFTKAVSQLSN